MAARKPSTEVATRKSTSIADIRNQLQQDAAEMTDRVSAPSSNRIRLQNKQFLMPGENQAVDGPIYAVVVDFVAKNALYEEAWDAENPKPPVCWSIGTVLKQMRPSPNAPKPQAESCEECPNNVFGSAGKGKACKNTRVLALLAPDADESTEMMTVEVSPTGIGHFDRHVNNVLSKISLPPIGAVTEIDFRSDKAYSSLTFMYDSENSNLEQHFARREEARKMITVEPRIETDEEEAPARPAKKKAAARRGRGR
jgi:hypothetical protein